MPGTIAAEPSLLAWRVSEAHPTTARALAGPSVLHRDAAAPAGLRRTPPPSYVDLALDQVVGALVRDRQHLDLRAILQTPLPDVDAVAYRHEVFRDLEDPAVRAALEAFTSEMHDLREHTLQAGRIRSPNQARRLHLDGAAQYVGAVRALAHALDAARPASRALVALRDWLLTYLRSPAYTSLEADVAATTAALDSVTYGLTLLEDRVHVRRQPAGADYAAELEATLARFARAPRPAAPVDERRRIGLNRVEASILDAVAQHHPAPFELLEAFGVRHPSYVDGTVERVDREVPFYLACLEFMDALGAHGVSFCLPALSASDKRVRVRGGRDLALALRLLAEGAAVVPNDVELHAGERVLVVTGANQGGKTTYARMVGQVHALAAVGMPVAASEARLPLVDDVLTHFEREEDPHGPDGRLQEELRRLRELLDGATGATLAIFNESFSSTSSDDALALGRDTIARVLERDALAVYVTFVDELAALGDGVVSLMATVDPDDPARRTYRILRRPADGRAHALAIARAHGLTYDALRARLRAPS